MTLFIVEDDSIQSLVLKMMVDKLGMTLIGIEAYGKNAVEKITKLKPEVVLLDVMLKDSFDGINVAQEIKKIYQPIVIYVTGNSDRLNKSRAEQFGFHDYITKPVTFDQLKSSIQDIGASY